MPTDLDDHLKLRIAANIEEYPEQLISEELAKAFPTDPRSVPSELKISATQHLSDR